MHGTDNAAYSGSQAVQVCSDVLQLNFITNAAIVSRKHFIGRLTANNIPGLPTACPEAVVQTQGLDYKALIEEVMIFC